MGVVECFADSSEGVYLFDDRAGHKHTGGILEDTAKLGDDIDEWFPEAERVYEADDRYRCQIFYRRIPDPGGGGNSNTYIAYVVVQKAQAGPDPILIRIDRKAGHGKGKPTTRRIEERADQWAFLVEVLDVETGL